MIISKEKVGNPPFFYLEAIYLNTWLHITIFSVLTSWVNSVFFFSEQRLFSVFLTHRQPASEVAEGPTLSRSEALLNFILVSKNLNVQRCMGMLAFC